MNNTKESIRINDSHIEITETSCGLLAKNTTLGSSCLFLGLKSKDEKESLKQKILSGAMGV